MFNFPRVNDANKIEPLLDKAASSEVPEKFTYRYLEKLGFKSSKERDLIPLLVSLRLVDQNSFPTNTYLAIKDLTQRKITMSNIIKDVYRPLFELDTEAYTADETLLAGYFGRLTGEGSYSVQKYTKTFKALCDWIDFTYFPENKFEHGKAGVQEVVAQEKDSELAGKEVVGAGNKKQAGAKINLNITLPSTTDEKVYESLFKHLQDLLNPQ